jgi:hypothetical protein
MPEHPGRAWLTAQDAAQCVGVVEEPPQQGEVGGSVLGVAEHLGGGRGVAVGQDHAPFVGDGARDQSVGVAILQTVTVQVLTEGGVGPAGHEQRVPRGVRVVQVAGQSPLLGGDEAAQPVASFYEGHRPAVLGQLGSGDQAVHA